MICCQRESHFAEQHKSLVIKENEERKDLYVRRIIIENAFHLTQVDTNIVLSRYLENNKDKTTVNLWKAPRCFELKKLNTSCRNNEKCTCTFKNLLRVHIEDLI